MVVTEFTYEQAKKLIDTPKVRLESDGKIVCKQKQIDCSAGLHANLMLQSKDEEFLFVWTINRSAKELARWAKGFNNNGLLASRELNSISYEDLIK